MAAASHYALDIAQLQVAIAFDNDPHYLWHHSVLMVKLDGLWRWVVATPTHEIKIMNLSDYNVAPLSPSRPIPRPLLWSFLGFEPVTDEQMQELMREARLVADIAVQWPVSDSHISVAPCVVFPSDESGRFESNFSLLRSRDLALVIAGGGVVRGGSSRELVCHASGRLHYSPPCPFHGGPRARLGVLGRGPAGARGSLAAAGPPRAGDRKDKGTHGFPSRASPKACGGGARLCQRICSKASSSASTGLACCSPFLCGLPGPYVKQEKGCRGRSGGRTRGRAARPDADVCENTSEFDASLRGRWAR